MDSFASFVLVVVALVSLRDWIKIWKKKLNKIIKDNEKEGDMKSC